MLYLGRSIQVLVCTRLYLGIIVLQITKIEYIWLAWRNCSFATGSGLLAIGINPLVLFLESAPRLLLLLLTSIIIPLVEAGSGAESLGSGSGDRVSPANDLFLLDLVLSYFSSFTDFQGRPESGS